jgi:iron complex outermembrane receptor protein
MNRKLTRLTLALTQALAGGLALGAVSSLAIAQNVQKAEKIEVTGSNIKRIDGESALPVTVISHQDIDRMAAATTEDLLRRITASTAMISDTTQGVGYAQSFANLRGLGPSSTLILLNGRRLANHAFGNIGGISAVDLNSIPLSAIDRVEVLRDGASAIYGTDAVGGVINFITRTDYTGAEVSVMYGDTEARIGGREAGVTVSYGMGELAKDRYNLLITGHFQNNQRVKAIDQKLYDRYKDVPGASAPTSFRAFPGRLADFGFSPGAYVGTVTSNPTLAPCDPNFTVLQTSGTTPSGDPRVRCRGLFPAYLDNIPDTHRADAFGRLVYDVSNDHQFFAEASFARNHSIGRIAPVPIDQSDQHVRPDGTQANVLMPITSRYAPIALINRLGYNINDVGTPGFLEIIYRSAPAGNRINDVTNDQSRISTGFKGLIMGWDYNTALTIAQAKDSLKYFGYIHEQRFLDALATGNLNPFGPNDAAGDALLNGAKMEGPMRESKSTTTQVDGKVSRDLMAMAGGPMALALGADVRREKIEDHPVNNDYRLGLHVGGEGTVPDVSASRNVVALFGELNLPVTKALEVSAAVRYDHYSDIGSKTNPRISVRWQPQKSYLLRASAGTGFRAPSLWDLKSPAQFGNTANQVDDPGCPAALIANGDPRCVQTQLTTRSVSSPTLKPETSKQWSAGFVLEPIPMLSLSADYWYIEKKDQIGVITGDIILADPNDLTLYNRYRARFVRNAAGTTLYLEQPAENLGGLKTAGVDIDAKMRFDAGVAKLVLSLTGTYLTRWEQQNGKDSPYVSYAGNNLNGGNAYPRWMHVAALDVSSGPWDGSLEQVFTNGWTETFQAGGTHRIPSTTRYNLFARFSGIPKTAIRVGVRNLLDKDPPFTDVSSNGSHAQGWANSVVDPRGRFWYVMLTYKFK